MLWPELAGYSTPAGMWRRRARIPWPSCYQIGSFSTPVRFSKKGFLEKTMFKLSLVSLCATIVMLHVPSAAAQGPCVQYRLMPRTIYETQKVTTWRDVQETQYRSETTKAYKPVWTTEQRENRYTVLKPVEETSWREERYTVLKPVVKTSYREQLYEETSWETTTEMHDQQVVEQVPVYETSYRDEQVIVRKPVTETQMQTENVTVYKPVTTLETQYVPGTSAVTQWTVGQAPATTNLQWLRPGYNFDATTGQYVWQRRGLHWVNSPGAAYYAPQTSLVPTMTPQTVQKTALVPETWVQQKPVTVTNYVDEVTSRKVPVQTYKLEQRVTTRKVPVEVQKPVKRYISKKIPFEETEYERQEVVRKVPVVTQRFEREERVEPVEVQVCRWEAVETQQQIPTVVTRRVAVESTQLVPRTVMMQVPVDMYGNPLQVATVPAAVPQYYAAQPTVASDEPQRVYMGRPDTVLREVPANESVEFPETRLKPMTTLVPIDRLPDGAVKSVDEGEPTPANSSEGAVEAADQQPSLEGNESGAAESGENQATPSVPAIDGPDRPRGDNDADKPKSPVGT
jgi:hypothetical protein